MAEKDGKFQICERCGSAVFIERIDSKVVNGWLEDVFEDRKEFEKHTETGYLCPKCEEIYKNFIKDFMDNKTYDISIKSCKKEFYNFM